MDTARVDAADRRRHDAGGSCDGRAGAGGRAGTARRPALYRARAAEDADVKATLQAIADIGYKELELLGARTLGTLVPMAKSLGLTPVSTHIPAPLVTGNWDAWATPLARRRHPIGTLAKTLDAARSHGVKYVVVSYLQPAERGTNAGRLREVRRSVEPRRRDGARRRPHAGVSQPRLRVRAARRRPSSHRRAPLTPRSVARETGARRVLGVDHRRRSRRSSSPRTRAASRWCT